MLLFMHNMLSKQILSIAMFAILLFSFQLLPKCTWAQKKCETAIAHAEKQYQTGQFDEVVIILERCLREGLKTEYKIKAYRLLGLTYLAKDSPLQAKQSIKKLLQLMPDWQPDPVYDHPLFIRMVEEIRDGVNNQIEAPPHPRYAEFPWPPPRASSSATIPDKFFRNIDTMAVLFTDVDKVIVSAIDSCGYFEKRYFFVPDGFAMVTRIEKINQDGTPKEVPERWEVEMKPVRKFSLGAYLKSLFTANPGYYRLIAFIITSHSFSQNDKTPNRKEFMELFHEGMNVLPNEISKLEYGEFHSCTALIYEFEKPEFGDEPVAKIPGHLMGKKHLEKSNILKKFEENYANFSNKM